MTEVEIDKLKKDEEYVVSLCDQILCCKGSRQHRFNFLVGDPDKNGNCKKLPVDVYYEKFELVIEYHERQHTESIKHFDKPDILTVSGVSRGEQRKIYDDRRRQVLPKNGIKILEISYLDFKFDSRKKIIRDITYDKSIIEQKVQQVVATKI